MSVYGGDSWAREAQHRKRRVDQLMLESHTHLSSSSSSSSSSGFKKLSNGKLACLVCPHHPVLDSSLILSMHSKGARHCAALSRLREKEIAKQEEINKRIALSDHPTTGNSAQRPRLPSKPLIEQTRKAASEILLHPPNALAHNFHENRSLPSSTNTVHHDVGLDHFHINSHHTTEATVVSAPLELDFRARREKELKFTSAGWKRDCHGRWYRDENVEFDSDEEDPNICLA